MAFSFGSYSRRRRGFLFDNVVKKLKLDDQEVATIDSGTGNVAVSGASGGGGSFSSDSSAPSSPSNGDLWYDTAGDVIYAYVNDGTSNYWIDISGEGYYGTTGDTATYTGNVSGGNLSTGGIVSASGNVTGGNLTTAGAVTTATVTATGNITGGNLTTAGAVAATGNISGAYIIGNGSQLTGMPEGYTDSDVTSLLSNFGSNPITTTGTITGKLSSSSLQVVHKVYTGKTTYSVATAGSTGTYIAVLDTAITPTKTSSKVRVEFNVSFEVHHDTILRLFRVIGGTTTEVRRNNDGNYWAGFAYPGYDVDNNSTPRTNHYIYIDSPNTTSAVTYRLMIQSGGVGATTFYLNRTIGSTGAANHENAISQCILTEIPV